MAIRSQHRCVSDANGRMHDFIARRHGAVRPGRFGAVLEMHQHLDLRADRLIEIDGFLAAAIKKQIWLHGFDSIFSSVHNFLIFCLVLSSFIFTTNEDRGSGQFCDVTHLTM
jgi:hypothetical protein